ncbi:MAG TPA: DUF4236 domain-containing protein [Niabella sp.]|nr:DUF4236 domain-containing protein [Niabella sp.]
MAWSYRRRIKIIPGVHLNFSKSGISTSIGVKGASLTLGKKGAYLNSGIPGLGIYNRQKLSGSNKPSIDIVPTNDNRPQLNYALNFAVDNIFSADPQEITSQDMQGVKEAILAAHAQRTWLNNDLQDVQKALSKSKTKLTISYLFLYGLIKKSISQKIKENIFSQKIAINKIQEEIENSAVRLDFEFEDDFLKSYSGVVDCFKRLCTSNKIWDVTSAYNQDRVIARSAASTIVNKKMVRLDIKAIPDIKSNFNPLYFQNGNGADIYFYPNFIIVYSSRQKFAIIGLNELQFNFTPVRFVETGTVPNDSKIIDRTWAKVNKNGTPDKRFKNNYEIPIVRYGNISLQTPTGLNEEYEFSNYEYAETFANAFLNYQHAIKTLRNI